MAAQRVRQSRKRRRGWLAFLLVLLLTAVAALAGWYLLEGRFTSTPALATLSKVEAEQVASKSGLEIRFEETYHETIARGQVVATDPSAGARVMRGTRIEAAVSLGPERYAMPSVVGLSQAAAEAAIQKANLAVGKVSGGYSETVATGIVLSASKSAGASLKRDAAISLVISQGPKPIKIKSYVGKPIEDAAAALTKAGFTVQVKEENSDKVAKDKVISQDPRSGTGMKGDTVTLTKSLGPVLVTVPNVRSMGVRAAEKVMRDAGFKTRVQAVTINYIGVGFVVYTNPSARSQAPKGSTITLFVV